MSYNAVYGIQQSGDVFAWIGLYRTNRTSTDDIYRMAAPQIQHSSPSLEWQQLSNDDCLEVKKEDYINQNSVLWAAFVHSVSDTHTHEQYLNMTA